MIRKALIATAAVASLAAISANQASAKVHINVGIGLPVYGGVYAPGPYVPAYDDGYYSDDCGYKVIKKKKWSNKYQTFVIIKKKVWVCY